MGGADADGGGLMGGGEEAGGPVAGAVGRDAATIWQDDEFGEIFVEGAKGVGDPGAGAGEAGEDEPGVLHEGGGAVDVGLRLQGMDEGHIVDTLGHGGEEVADPLAGLAVLLPGPGAGHDDAGVALEEFDFFAGVPGLALFFDEAGLVVEGVALAGGTGEKDLDYAFGTGLVMEAVTFLPEHLGEGEAAERTEKISSLHGFSLVDE